MDPKLVKQEEGVSEVLEFLILIPMLLAIALLIWQMFVVGHAMVVTVNAAREGARAATVCDGSVSAGKHAARVAGAGYTVRPEISGGSTVKATVYTKVPMLAIPLLYPKGNDIEIQATARMRREPKCP